MRKQCFIKSLAVLALLTSLPACTAEAKTTLSFSADYKIAIPQSFLADATVFATDELAVKSASGQLFAGKVLSADSEQLPADFDFSLYPDYLLKLKAVAGLSSELRAVFENSAAEIDYSYGLANIEVEQQEGWKLFSLCKEQRCLAYVMKDDNVEYILSVHAQGMSRADFTGLIKGGLHVEN
ncbi:hypothetical protein SAMN06297280_1025 [Arsukibacterium tuosuense]|uniref:Uncharacterized protein n=1 Tax=Arsukibacterium tuosuense TaxID=1323745 RepID=A0A285IDN9_9GAMM|nr:hypothetical protein [Arsukibacterium tuosuense]SNY46043.1 hypothetical protein SAMN06297280_1025 [Arsukibacterium tuosuense]